MTTRSSWIVAVLACLMSFSCSHLSSGSSQLPGSLANLDEDSQTFFPISTNNDGSDSVAAPRGNRPDRRVTVTVYRTGTAVCVAPHVIATSTYLLPQEEKETETTTATTMVVDLNSIRIGQPGRAFQVLAADRFGSVALIRIAETCKPAELNGTPVSKGDELTAVSADIVSHPFKQFRAAREMHQYPALVTQGFDSAMDWLYADTTVNGHVTEPYDRPDSVRIMSHQSLSGQHGSALLDSSGRLVGLENVPNGSGICSVTTTEYVISAVKKFNTQNRDLAEADQTTRIISILRKLEHQN